MSSCQINFNFLRVHVLIADRPVASPSQRLAEDQLMRQEVQLFPLSIYLHEKFILVLLS